MDNDTSLKSLLFKFSFLYTGNSQLANQITERFINEHPTYITFSKIESVQKLVNICRAENKKTAHLKWAIANAVTFHRIKKTSFISKLSSLSIVKREIALLHFVADIPIKTISEIVNMHEVKVRANMKKLELELIPYFPNDDLLVKEHINLALADFDKVEEERILAIDQIKQLRVLKWFTFTSSIVVFVLLAGGFFYISQIQENDEALTVSTPNLIGKDAQSVGNRETTSDSTENLNGNSNHTESPYMVQIPEQITFQIAVYENFYNEQSFYSTKQTKYNVIQQMLEMYYVRKFMYDHNIFLSDEMVESLMSLSNYYFDTAMQIETVAVMRNKILTELNISKEDFIQNYLYPVLEKDELTNIMVEKEMSLLESLGNIYAIDSISNVFFESVGLSKEEFEEIGILMTAANWEEVKENPVGLPFNIVGSYLKVSSKDGKLYIDNPEQFSLDSTVYAEFYYKYFLNDLGMLLKRNTFKTITSFLDSFKSEEEQENTLAAELLELLRALERSVEWELQG